MSRYAVKERFRPDEVLRLVRTFDDLQEAIAFAKNRHESSRRGRAIHQVYDYQRDAVKFQIGWMDRTLVLSNHNTKPPEPKPNPRPVIGNAIRGVGIKKPSEPEVCETCE